MSFIDDIKEATKEVIWRRLLWDRIIKGECWLYRYVDPRGYGVVELEGKQYRVHRLSAWIHLDLDMDNTKLLACHKCDVRSCFNPDHLFLGSCKDNLMDAARKGKMNQGNLAVRHEHRKNNPFCSRGHIIDGKQLYGLKLNRYCKKCKKEKDAIRRDKSMKVKK